MDFTIGLFVFFLAVAYVGGTKILELVGKGIYEYERSVKRQQNRLLNGSPDFNYCETYCDRRNKVATLYDTDTLYELFLNDEDLKEYKIDNKYYFGANRHEYISKYTTLILAREGIGEIENFFIFQRDGKRKEKEAEKDKEMDKVLKNLRNAHPELIINMTKTRKEDSYLSLHYRLDVKQRVPKDGQRK